jgi:anaerobic magnesium-protoporphyrin IX monomethyl ester cyclase
LVDVLLTHSYHLYYDRKQLRKMQPYPPLGTLYAAAVLRQNGFSVALFDSMLDDPEVGFPKALQRYRPKVVAIYEDNFNFLSKMCLSRMREIAFGMIESAQARGCKVVVNGSDASDRSVEYLKSGADYVLIGEAEWTLLELVQSLIAGSGRDDQEIRGVVYRDRQSESIIRTAPRGLMTDLEMLPSPARDLIDVEKYRQAWKQAHGFFSMNLVASRGCPYRCNWCAKPIYGDSFHARSPRAVAAEMRQLKEVCGAEHLWFADDLFGARSRWIHDLAVSVEEQDAAVPFKMQSRVDLMGADTAGFLRRAGCVEVWMGVESGSQKILDAMDKGTHITQIPTAVGNLRSSGIRACFFVQFGYPGETWPDIQQTIQLIRHTCPDDVGVSVSYPLPGTKFYERVSERLGDKTNWVDSDDLAMMFKGAYKSEFYRALHDAIHAEVKSWSNPEWRFRLRDGAAVDGEGQQTSVDDLWKRVSQLERTCRNSDPTQLAAMAGAAIHT